MVKPKPVKATKNLKDIFKNGFTLDDSEVFKVPRRINAVHGAVRAGKNLEKKFKK